MGIIGFGQFGQFMATHLKPHTEVVACDIHESTDASLSTLEQVSKCDIVIFAVPAQELENAVSAAVPYIAPGTLITDVSSVKVRPLQILQKHFPQNELLGTHPIFGPQSGKNGIVGLPIVLANVSWSPEHYEMIRLFFSQKLGLRVIERTPEEHDKEMAHVQGLAHFIGRAVSHLHIRDYETGTLSYHHLVELRDLLKDDSWELFKTIENENPYAQDVRKDFLETLHLLDEKLRKE